MEVWELLKVINVSNLLMMALKTCLIKYFISIFITLNLGCSGGNRRFNRQSRRGMSSRRTQTLRDWRLNTSTQPNSHVKYLDEGLNTTDRGTRSSDVDSISDELNSLVIKSPKKLIDDFHIPEWVLKSAELWIPALNKAWFSNVGKDEKLLQDIMSQCLEESRNPYYTSLQICVLCPDFCNAKSNAKHTLAFSVMKSFHIWLKREESSKARRFYATKLLLTDEVKTSAFAVVVRHYNEQFFKLFYEIFDFSINPRLFVPYVREAITSHRHVEACHFIAALKLHTMFTIEDTVFPAFLQNNLAVVYEYLSSDHELQCDFVAFLDKLHGDGAQAFQYVDNLKLPKYSPSRLQAHSLSKMVQKLAKKFNVPKTFWPKVSETQAFATLRYLMYKNYVEKAIPLQDWEDLLKEVVGDRLRVQNEAVSLLASHDDVRLAARLAVEWNIPPADLPSEVANAVCVKTYDRSTSDTKEHFNEYPSRNVKYSTVYEDDDDYDDDPYADIEDSLSDDDDDPYLRVKSIPIDSRLPKTFDKQYYSPVLPEICLVDTRESFQHCIRHITQVKQALLCSSCLSSFLGWMFHE